MALVSLFVATAAWATVSNKAILNGIVADSNFLFFVQGVGTVILLKVGAMVGTVNASVVTIDTNNREQFIVAIAYAANVAFGLCSLFYVSIPMFGALKRLTILACWVGELFLEKTSATYAVIPALLVMTGGTIVAGWNDLEFSFQGYVYGLLSCAGQGLAFVLSKTVAKKSKKSEATSALDSVLSVVYLNSVVSSVLMGVLLTFTTHWRGDNLWKGGVDMQTGAMHCVVNVVSILFLNVVIFLDCTLNTPLTHAVAGNLKAAVTSIAGLIIFETELTTLGAAGLILNLAGGVWYSIVRINLKKKKPETPTKEGTKDKEEC